MDADGVEHVPGILLVVTASAGAEDLATAFPDGAFRLTITRASVAEAFATGEAYDAVVLWVDSGNGTAVALVHDLRGLDPSIPILVHAATANDADIGALVDAGADDCVVTPISPQLLGTRLRALLRRSSAFADRTLASGDITIDPRSHTLSGPNATVHLTQREFGVLAHLISRQRSVVPRAELLHQVWGYEFDPGTSVLDVTISRVRRKIAGVGGMVTLRAIRGVGFMLHSGRGLLPAAL